MLGDMQKLDSPTLEDWMEDEDSNFRELERWHKGQTAKTDSATAFKPINQGHPNSLMDSPMAQPMLDIDPSAVSLRPYDPSALPQFAENGSFWADLHPEIAHQNVDDPTNMGGAGWIQQYGQVTPPDDLTPLPKGSENSFLGRISQEYPVGGTGVSGVDEVKDDLEEARLSKEDISPVGGKSRKLGSQPSTGQISQKQPSKGKGGKRTKNRKVRESDPKRQEFLARNRLAASKSRQKKKEWTSQLESRCRELQAERAHLGFFIGGLKEEIILLKTEMLKHSNCKCDGIRKYLSQSANSLSQPLSDGSPSQVLQSPASEHALSIGSESCTGSSSPAGALTDRRESGDSVETAGSDGPMSLPDLEVDGMSNDEPKILDEEAELMKFWDDSINEDVDFKDL